MYKVGLYLGNYTANMPVFDCTIYALLIAGVALSIITKKLTAAGAITGGVVGLLIFKGAGFCGLIMLAAFFVAGSVATGWQISKKQQSGIAERDKGRRTAGQVIANGGVAAILGGIAWYNPQLAPLMQLMIAGSLAAAMADTLSSELGVIYGRRFFDVLSFKSSLPGPDGIISLEGTLIGVAGASIIALIYSLSYSFSLFSLIIIAAGATGNVADSILGATLERKHLIGNNAVNFLNTAVGAIICLLVQMWCK
jgi:uncharacterized protein (TIGR00297 family)